MGIFFFKYKTEIKVITEHKLVAVKLNETKCSGTGNNRSYSVFSYKDKIHLVNLKGEDCNKYIPGTVVELLYSEGDNVFYPKDLSYRDEINGIIIITVVLLLSIINFVFPREIVKL